jgi:purine nucleoside permease
LKKRSKKLLSFEAPLPFEKELLSQKVVSMRTLMLAALLATTIGHALASPLPIRVVVVTTFEVGKDSGDTAGEFQEWVEKLPLAEILPFPQAYHDLRLNRSLSVLGIVTGEGPTRAAASIEALGNDPRFDLTHAYFVLAGIAGVDPKAGSVGAAFWALHVVDGDLAHEIDAREIPPDWKTGYVPLQRAHPYELPVPPAQSISGSSVYSLNAGLVRWAYQQTSKLTLPDSDVLKSIRIRYAGFPAAQKPAQVAIGDTLAAGTFWLGARMNGWAEDWVSYWTKTQGRFATTAEEDAGFMQSLTFLSQVHKVDLNRVLVLRTASNFDMPPPGETPAEMLAAEARPGSLSAFKQSVDAAYIVGSAVVRSLATHWKLYEGTIPDERH